MLQLEDLIANYPPSDVPQIQTIVSSKREFKEVGALAVEAPPIPGKTFYNNQEFLLRYMIPNDRIFMDWETGTGKSCGLVALAEYYHRLYLKDPDNAPIKKTIALTPGPGLREELKLQIACRCTAGEYLTSNVLEAKNTRTQRRNLTLAVNKWYTIETYKRFILPLEELSDDEVRRKYSHVIIFIDEAHNLNITGKGGEKGKLRLYQQLWRFLHLTEGSKIILATATPMVNETREIVPLMNLLLPADHQLPEAWNYDTVTLEQMEPYLRGKISYVRALDTGIDVVLQGDQDTIGVETPEGPIDATLTVKVSIMKDIQLQTYLETLQQPDGIYGRQREASNFVFPDGSWGGSFPREVKAPREGKNGERPISETELRERAVQSGLGKYVTSPSADIYTPTEEFKPWLRVLDQPDADEPHLGRLGCKYETTIREVQAGTLGTVFAYNDFVFGSGAIVLALAFEVNGFERYKGDTSAFRDITGAAVPHPCSSQSGARQILIEKAPRCALITSDTSDLNRSRILDLFSSPENIHGEYIKVLIGSQVTREGLNLSHGTQAHLETTWWNRAANYQAISRVIRATSHVALLNEQRRLLEAEGRDPNEASVTVDIFQHAALPAEGDYDGSIDIYMYRLANEKDYSIRRMERILKKIAVDCWIHYERNIRSTDVDGSAACDYAECAYQCFSPKPDLVDTETYDVYYIDESLNRAGDIISELMSTNFSLSRSQLYSILGEDNFRPVEVDRALTKIMSEKRVIYDRYGFVSYLREDGDHFFLQRDFPLLASSDGSQALEIYTSDLIATREVSIPKYLSWLDADVQGNLIAELFRLPPRSPNLDSKIDELNPEGRILLLETALLNYLNQKQTPITSRIIEHFHNVLYILSEPVDDIAVVEERLNQRGKGRGRPPKEGGKQKIIKVDPEDLQDPIEDLTFDQVEDLLADPSKSIVFVHTLYNNTLANRVSYNVSTRSKKGDGHIRILKPSEEVGWRDAKINELPVYGAIIEGIWNLRIAPFEEFNIYGTLLHDGEFRIRDKTTERTRIQEGTGRKDIRFGKRGRICGTFDKKELITILWKLGVEAPPSKKALPKTEDDLIDNLIRKHIIVVDDDLDEWDLDRLIYYTKWDNFGYRPAICNEIQRWLMENNRLLTS